MIESDEMNFKKVIQESECFSSFTINIANNDQRIYVKINNMCVLQLHLDFFQCKYNYIIYLYNYFEKSKMIIFRVYKYLFILQ